MQIELTIEEAEVTRTALLQREERLLDLVEQVPSWDHERRAGLCQKLDSARAAYAKLVIESSKQPPQH